MAIPAASTTPTTIQTASWRPPVLFFALLQGVLHLANHVADAGSSHPGWAGPLDVVVEFHPPLSLADRKQLAQQAEKLVRDGHIRALAGLA